MLIRGSCHCGNIDFSLIWEPDPAQIPARACNCSFCRKHSGVWTSYPQGVLRISINDPALATSYAFATRTADFHICTRCGVVPVATSRIADRLYSVVNVNSFHDLDTALLRLAASDVQDETETARLDRRIRNWIAHVVFDSGTDAALKSGIASMA